MFIRLFGVVLLFLLVLFIGILFGVDRENKKIWIPSLIILIIIIVALGYGWYMIPTDW